MVVIAALWWFVLGALLLFLLLVGFWSIPSFIAFALWPAASLLTAVLLARRPATVRLLNWSIALSAASVAGSTYGLLTSNSGVSLIHAALILSIGAGITGVVARARLNGSDGRY